MKKEAISHGVLDDLANRNENWDKLDGVPEKVDLLMESKADKTYVDTKLSEKANKQQEAWITPVLLNGATFPASVEGVKFRKNQFGELEFKGEIATVASGAQFTLPTGYYNTSKPKRNNIWIIGSNTRTTYQISTTGTFAIYGAGQFSLDGLVLAVD